MKKRISLALALGIFLANISGCSTEIQEEVAQEFITEKYADVIVVGAGASGMMAALSAVQNGAESVIIVEKTSQSGGSLNAVTDTLSAANTIIQELDDITGDSMLAYQADIIAQSLGGKIDEDIIEVYANGATKIVSWLWENGLNDNEFKIDDMGKKSQPETKNENFSTQRVYFPSAHNSDYSSASHEILDKLVLESDVIEIVFNTEIIELVGNEKGQVLSAIGEQNEQNIQFYAQKGIVMATGGYTNNSEMIAMFNEFSGNVITTESDNSDGLGIRLMQEMGGMIDYDSMGVLKTYGTGLASLQEKGVGIIASTKTQFVGGILVNANGERFVNETDPDPTVREQALTEQPYGIQYEIYTDKIVNSAMEKGVGDMLNDMFLREEYADYLVSAETLEELAMKLSLPMDTFVKTVLDYNASVSTSVVDEFGRNCGKTDKDSNLAINKIEGDMYYAVKTQLISVATLGGITVNSDMQVTNSVGTVIPGLYAAGEVIGGVWGNFATSGILITSALVFGDIAGEKVMKNELSANHIIQPAINLLPESLFWENVSETEIDTFTLEGASDGEYEVSVDGQNGKMKILVVIENEKLMFVQILSHNETEIITDEVFATYPEAIVRANTTNIDVIAGATLTCERIKKAVEIATQTARR